MKTATNTTHKWFSLERDGDNYKVVIIGDTHTVKVPVTRQQISEIIDILKGIK